MIAGSCGSEGPRNASDWMTARTQPAPTASVVSKAHHGAIALPEGIVCGAAPRGPAASSNNRRALQKSLVHGVEAAAGDTGTALEAFVHASEGTLRASGSLWEPLGASCKRCAPSPLQSGAGGHAVVAGRCNDADAETASARGPWAAVGRERALLRTQLRAGVEAAKLRPSAVDRVRADYLTGEGASRDAAKGKARPATARSNHHTDTSCARKQQAAGRWHASPRAPCTDIALDSLCACTQPASITCMSRGAVADAASTHPPCPATGAYTYPSSSPARRGGLGRCICTVHTRWPTASLWRLSDVYRAPFRATNMDGLSQRLHHWSTT
jgi:hypothetical protein